MHLVKAFLLIVLLTCPLAFCRGQLSLRSIGGEDGYTALRGEYIWDLDNDFILTPSYSYYQRTDSEKDKEGSTSRYGLMGEYWLNDSMAVSVGGNFVPQILGFEEWSYYARTKWLPFYQWGWIKKPVLTLSAGQGRYDVEANISGLLLQKAFKSFSTGVAVGMATEVAGFYVQGAYQKVLKYSNEPSANITANWADIPFMTAVVQGFVQETVGLRVAYSAHWIQPYVAWSTYQYASTREYVSATAVGLGINLGAMHFTGGVEVFAPRRNVDRKTYFSIAAEVAF